MAKYIIYIVDVEKEDTKTIANISDLKIEVKYGVSSERDDYSQIYTEKFTGEVHFRIDACMGGKADGTVTDFESNGHNIEQIKR